jgi:class 3 adenylate cyclase
MNAGNCVSVSIPDRCAGTSGNAFDIWGDAVNIASHMESSSEPGKVHISEKTKDYLEGFG